MNTFIPAPYVREVTDKKVEIGLLVLSVKTEGSVAELCTSPNLAFSLYYENTTADGANIL